MSTTSEAEFHRGSHTAEKRLQLLYEAGRRLNRSLEPTALFEALTELVKQVLPCDGLLVSSYSPEDDLIRCEFAWVDGQIHDAKALPPLPLERSGKGMQSQVILTGCATIFDVAGKVKDRTDYTYSEMGSDGELKPVESEGPSAKSAMMAPMKLEDQVIGVVQVMSDLPNAYSPDDLDLLEALMVQLSPAVHNMKLYLRLKEELIERQVAEQALRESERLFKTLIDSMPAIAWSNDGKTHAGEYINRSYHEYTGLDPSIPAVEGWGLVVHPDDAASGRKLVEKSYAEGVPWEQEVRLKRADGEYRWHLSRMVPLKNEQGEVIKWLGTSTDIHNQKEAEAELERRVQERTAEMKSAIRELEGFTYSVSHDLRGPLRAIISNCSILRSDFSDVLPPEADELLQKQAGSAKKLANLIDDLLRLSRITRQEMSRQHVDVTAMCHELVSELAAEGRIGEVRIEIEGGIQANADPRLLRLVYLNLIDNACKFSPNGGVVRVGTSQGGYFVSDEGIGFDMQYAERLFKPFERLVRDGEFPGTGIGLANVKRIIDRHGGTIAVDSTPGAGTIFTFTLHAE